MRIILYVICKLEVVSARDGGLIQYRVYLAAYSESFLPTFNELAEHIQSGALGYGIYFGQKQFKAEADEFSNCDSIAYKAESNQIHSLCRKDNFIRPKPEEGIILCSDNIPLDMEKIEENLRKTTRSEQIIYEQNGKPLNGEFRNCYQVNGKIIGFYE